MTTGEMHSWLCRLKSILSGSREIRHEHLTQMLKDLEQAYGVHAGNGERLEIVNPFALQLYQTVTEWRGYDG